ncbi:MAG TPA: tetratricopeptide repeat protein [Trinickia sp.]|nr:tetratricopeptide repeat protein [Trinickia sp.]
MKRFLAAALGSLLLISSAAFAAPTVQQVERAMQQGDWQTADAELAQVIDAHPNNAHAHYLYGQVLANEGRYAEGLAQIDQAKTLDPQMRFADPARFAQIEARVRAAANHAAAPAAQPHSTANSFVQTQPAAAVNPHHGVSMAAWIGLALVVVAIALVLRWTLRRARSNEDGRADEERRAQLRRATELLNAARSLKLDARLSSAPGHESLASEVEGVENQLRQLVETLSSGGNSVPSYRLDELDRQLASLKARAEGRPDPNAAAASGPSVYAQEAERLQQQGPYGPQQPYPSQQQPPVVVQQGGGFGSGLGGLLTGVLLGEALSHGRDRVIERDVYIDDDEARRRHAANNDGNVDYGQGSNDWNDNGGGGVDFGSDDSGGGWSDT